MSGFDTGAVTLEACRERLVASLSAPGRIAAAFAAVPRHHFLPARIRRTNADAWVDLETDPDAWAALAYADEPVMTQVDDGAPEGPGVPTSSSSMPSVMAAMLQAAGVGPGDRVLEIGTGTGYNAAILSELVGPTGQVTTVEVDADVAASARRALILAGYGPRVVTADGATAVQGEAAFDAVIATCAVVRVPTTWLAQTREGGVVVTPWKPNAALPGGLMARLTVRGGAGEGRFTGGSAFMLMRAQRWTGGAGHDPQAEPEEISTAEGDPREIVVDERCGPQLAMMVPAWRWGAHWPHGRGSDHYVWVSALDGRSWARLHANGRVEQAGPRRLWDELVSAHRAWDGSGRPDITSYGLTVTADGTHRVWLAEPDGPSWTLPG